MIIQKVLEKVGITKATKNINAYINECHQIIKQTICSRSGYVKHQIVLQMAGRLDF
jgi:hypothetical protein